MFEKHRGKVGIRPLKMYIERESGEVLNLKRIARIKKKYGLETRKRIKTNASKNMQIYHEHKTCPNLLKQNFKINEERKVFSTDVTYLFNKNGSKAYLSAVKDLGTREIVGFEVSRTNDLDFVIGSVKRSLRDVRSEGLVIHSDQGYQYTNDTYQGFLKEHNVTQSMSRRGNCLDNAPIESFFGHLKDEVDYKNYKNIEELTKKISAYVRYYNEKRPQWGLERKTPVEYRSFIK